jgi:hypothetical protein
LAITKEQFVEQCKPRFGISNPERMTMPVWEWLTRTGEDVYVVRKQFELGSTLKEARASGVPQPDWCFKRFGMTKTAMPDGRIICIGGEHEDSYDPNFCIYNDVVVIRPAESEAWVTKETGSVEIYGYPREAFPPTDFHTATLVRGHIYIIGRLGYPEDRAIVTTPVYRLDSETYRIETVRTKGPSPGLLHDHHADFDVATGSILVRGGFLDATEAGSRPRNHAVYRLHLSDNRWELARERERHRRFMLDTTDGHPSIDATLDDVSPRRLPFHVILVENEFFSRFKISVESVRVTFEDIVGLRMFVEGDLPEATLNVLLEDVLANLGRRSGVSWEAKEVDSFDAP